MNLWQPAQLIHRPAGRKLFQGRSAVQDRFLEKLTGTITSHRTTCGNITRFYHFMTVICFWIHLCGPGDAQEWLMLNPMKTATSSTRQGIAVVFVLRYKFTLQAMQMGNNKDRKIITNKQQKKSQRHGKKERHLEKQMLL